MATLRIESDGEVRDVTRCDFLDDNRDDQHVWETVRRLGPGESATFGGGAAPVTRVTLYAVEPRDVITLSVPTLDPWALGDATALLTPQDQQTRIRVALAMVAGTVFPADLRWGGR